MEHESGETREGGGPLAGLDPADLLKQGAAEDTLADAAGGAFGLPPVEELQEIFPQFEILGLIGKGGMGAVYQVRQKALDRIVALKILPPEIGDRPGFAERFTREARALAKLNHPGIVTLHEFGQAAGLYFILMEYVDGVNLRDLLLNGRIAPREALAIVPQICDALQFAHDRGIIHRDIKPENILLDRLGRVKVADFGLAKLAGVADPAADGGAVEAAAFTEAGKVMGTPRYMAPEQLEAPSEVDHRADIYALGVVFYQMLTGELPGRALEPPSVKVRVDVRLDEVVLRALERDPALRFQQASVMKTRVEDMGDPVPAASPASAVNPWNLDYRTKREWFGLPLLHVTSGPDPETGKERVAKGIIAIGGSAKGVLAIGGRATGIIAMGGFTTGLVSFGGFAIGLVSFGGMALGLGAAFGGMAVAPVAVGGNALGYYSFGGSANGVHPLGPNRQDPEAIEFFHPWSISMMMNIGFALAAVAAFVFLVGFGVPMIVMRRLASPPCAAPRSTKKIRAAILLVSLLAGLWVGWSTGLFGGGGSTGGERRDVIAPLVPEALARPSAPPEFMAAAWMQRAGSAGTSPWQLSGVKASGLAAPGARQSDENFNRLDAGEPWNEERTLCLLVKQPPLPSSSLSFSVGRLSPEMPEMKVWAVAASSWTDSSIRCRILMGKSEALPLSIPVRLEYDTGDWVERGRIHGDHEFSIDADVTIKRPGQSKEGEALFRIRRQGPVAAGDLRYEVTAITRKGGRAPSVTRGDVKENDGVTEEFRFAIPLRGIDHFELRSRPVRSLEWEVPLPPMEEIGVMLLLDGQVRAGGDTMSRAEFMRRMKPLLAYDPNQKVVMRQVPEELSYEKVREFVTACQDAGIWNVSFGDRSEEQGVAVKAGVDWLEIVDGGDYAGSWGKGSALFQKGVTSEAWTSSMALFRKQLGAVSSRKVKAVKALTSGPGVPDGEYLVIQFETSFEKKKEAIETLSLVKEADGIWRSAGYFIR